jgi:hypothetical protein
MTKHVNVARKACPEFGASDLTVEHKRTLRRARVRRHRALIKSGGAVLKIVAPDFFGLVEAVADANWMTLPPEGERIDEAKIKRQVEAAISQALADMAAAHARKKK